MTMTIPAEALHETALFFYRNGMGKQWSTVYDEAMQKLAGSIAKSPGTDNRERSNASRRTRNKISQAGQKILDSLTGEGMPKREIVKATGLTAAQYEAGVKSLERGKLIYWRNGRCFKGAPPTRAQASGASGGARPRASKAPAELTEACLTALQELPPGATNEQIRAHAEKALGKPTRPNHVGIALARHKRAGNAEQRGDKWFLPGIEELRQAS